MIGRWLRKNIARVVREEMNGLQQMSRRLLKLEEKNLEMLREQNLVLKESLALSKEKHSVLEGRLGLLESHAIRSSEQAEFTRLLSGGLAARQVRQLPSDTPFRLTEFQVFSQFGEDGIIQFLLAHVPIPHEVFVEFGVEDYSEANTRFLLLHDSWRGLILDGSDSAMRSVAESSLSWRHHLDALSSWITAENINEIILGNGIKGDIGLLSIDVDGVDYWIWKALDAVQPRIVVCEYNALFGPDLEVTVPYDPAFDRSIAHYSGLFFGASLAALTNLADQKGYWLVGVNSAGNNAFFVRKDVIGSLPKHTSAEVFQSSRFRESRNQRNELTHLNYAEAQRLISDCVVLDLKQGMNAPLADIPGWIGLSLKQ